ncbi:unnamed protein product [Prunus brigantina]
MSLEIVICSSTHPSNHRVSNVESRAVKHGADSSMLIPLEVRLAYAMKARESFAWAKSSSATGDASMSDLLKMNFLSSPSACAKLVDQIRQASDLGTFSSLSLEKQRETRFHLLQKRGVGRRGGSGRWSCCECG